MSRRCSFLSQKRNCTQDLGAQTKNVVLKRVKKLSSSNESNDAHHTDRLILNVDDNDFDETPVIVDKINKKRRVCCLLSTCTIIFLIPLILYTIVYVLRSEKQGQVAPLNLTNDSTEEINTINLPVNLTNDSTEEINTITLPVLINRFGENASSEFADNFYICLLYTSRCV